MSRFATGVTVATTCLGSRRLGITVNAFTSVSLDPPLVLICIERAKRIHQAFLDSGIFAVNFLSAEQEALSTCFSGTSDYRYNEFCGARSHTEVTGAPILDTSLGFVDCRIVKVYDGGDHSIFLGLVEALKQGDGQPLLYYGSRYAQLS